MAKLKLINDGKNIDGLYRGRWAGEPGTPSFRQIIPPVSYVYRRAAADAQLEYSHSDRTNAKEQLQAFRELFDGRLLSIDVEDEDGKPVPLYVDRVAAGEKPRKVLNDELLNGLPQDVLFNIADAILGWHPEDAAARAAEEKNSDTPSTSS